MSPPPLIALTWALVVGPPAPEVEPEPATDPGEYVIFDAAPASAFEEPAPSPIEFEAGAMTMTRVELTRTRSVDGEGESRTTVPMRLRARLEARSDRLHMLAEFQDARVLADPIGPARSGFHQLYAEHVGRLPGGTLTFRAGRQEYSLGSEHLFGPGPWGAGMRSWDALRLQVERSRGGVDLFAGSFARPLLSSGVSLVDRVAGNVALAWVVDGHYRIHDALVVEGLVYGAHQRTSAESRNLYTPGLRVHGELGAGVGYDAEGYLQLGTIERPMSGSRQRHAATAAYASLDYLTPRELGPAGGVKLGGELSLDYASGSRCTTTEFSGFEPCTEGTSRDFDAPWRARHRWYGHADRFRGQNIIDGALGVHVETRPLERVRLDLGVTNHVFALAQPDGRWQSAGGQLVAVDPDNRDPWAADEIDIEGTIHYRWLRVDFGWLIVANLSGGQALSGEALRQFVYLQLMTNF